MDDLTSAFVAEKEGCRRWLLLDCLIDVADPGDSHRPWPEWACSVAEELPYLMRVYIDNRLEKRRKQLKKDSANATGGGRLT